METIENKGFVFFESAKKCRGVRKGLKRKGIGGQGDRWVGKWKGENGGARPK